MYMCRWCESTILLQHISELQIIGHHPGIMTDQVGEGGASRMRLRTDSLDSLGETDSLSSADHDGQEELGQG